MKLICANDFFNTKSLGITIPKSDKWFRHENHVHKGFRFSIGTAETYDDLGPEDKERAGLLMKHGLAILDNEDNVKNKRIAKIDAEAEAEYKAHKAALQKPPTLAEAVASAVAEALVAAGVIKAKGA